MLKLTLKQIRIHHWIKNFLIFLPIFFSGNFTDTTLLGDTILVFLMFSFIASCIYIINDLVDIEEDRKHAIKKHRPLASGKLSINYAYMVMIGLFTATLIIGAYLGNNETALILLTYFVGNLIYSSTAKHIAILDMFLLSSFYILRLYSGAVVTDIMISGWLFTTILFGTLSMIAAKRYTEIRNDNIRKVLKSYTKETLHSLLIMFLTLTGGSFALYAITVIQDQAVFIPQILIFTFLLSRYYFLAETTTEAETPELLVVKDTQILVALILLVFTAGMYIY